MEEIISQFQKSIADGMISKQEKDALRKLVVEQAPDQDKINFLRSKMFEIANEKITPENYKFILEWVKNINSTLNSRSSEKSEAYFSPGETCRNSIINHINSATGNLKICVFTISDDVITSAILAAHKRNVAIRILTDNDKLLDIGSDITTLSKAGISIRIDNTPNHMHHKFMIIDDESLITGSYNWTRSAAMYNHENIIVTTEGGLVREFKEQFEKLWNGMGDFV
ncbi:MAG: DUF1669 domain-containing protein [Cyclobacteriaceae bacterium]|nr:DUF1669 domain-containing protein [Cyclobacteriaceae bacterium]